MSIIRIRNLKSIAELEFAVPPVGVNVLTGINGSGKTTLLTCLERLINPYAFQKHFKTSSIRQFDNFQASEISYEHNGSRVTYIYRNTRWSPNPRNNASILQNFGFPQVLYITSSAERFYIQNEELNTRNISAAPQFFKDAMNNIFQTQRFNDLRRVKLSGSGRGSARRNYGFLLPLPPKHGQSRYFTEKNFSLGEILILNALFELNYAVNDSLVLIDEVELALHPKVQVRFLRFLEQISINKNLTIILSTHSTSLIKAAPKLIYLERDSTTGKVSVEYDCYPAIALQNVAVTEEVQPDVVLYVEDQFARFILEHLLDYYFKTLYHGRRPIIKILPVGGWEQTIRFSESSAIYLIPANTAIVAILDLDVQTYIAQIQAKLNRTDGEQQQLALYNANIARVKFLPITPELGLVNMLNANPIQHIQPIQDFFNAVFDIEQILQDEANRAGIARSPNPRKNAKMVLDYCIDRIHQATNRDVNQIRNLLAQYFVLNYGPQNHGPLQALFNPIF